MTRNNPSASVVTPSTPADSEAESNGHEFLLFIRGATPASNTAIHQFRHFCADRFETGRWVLEIVDLQDTPDAAREHAVFVTPTVVMRAGSVTRKIVGDLRNEAAVAAELRLGVA